MSGRNTMWQVLAVYVGASWVALQVVDLLKDNMGLPDWVFPFALALLLIGLPVMLTTAIVQGKREAMLASHGESADAGTESQPAVAPSSPAEETHHRLFTWRNALIGGGLALALIVGVTSTYMVMRTRGIGPVGSLVAKGVLDERSQVILADIVAEDMSMSRAATEALRVDLSQTRIIRVLEPSVYAGALERMQRDPSEPLTIDVAREVAVREGIPAVIGGEITQVGGGFVLTASLSAAGDGAVLASHRETAANEDEIIPAIDRLSRKIREKIGESYTSLRADAPLAAVTTSSLEALELYSEALVAIDQRGDSDGGIRLLEEALEIDPEFASAWRKLGIELRNARREHARSTEALTRAFELRDRLTPRERYLTEGSYYNSIRFDQAKAIEAYERMLDLDPNDDWAINNLAIIYQDRGDNERSLEMFERAAALDTNSISVGNVMFAQIRQGLFAEAAETAALGHRLFPGDRRFYAGDRSLALNLEDYDRVLAIADAIDRDLDGELPAHAFADFSRGTVASLQGRIADAIEHDADANAHIREFGAPGGRFNWSAAWETLDVLNDTVAAARITADMLAAAPLEELEPLDRPYLGLSTLYAAMGDEASARGMLDAFREAVPDAPDARWTDDEAVIEAILSQIAGRYDEAIEHWMRLRELEPGCQTCGFDGIARAHDAAGRTQEAIDWYTRDLETPRNGGPPSRGPIFERLGQLYDAQGDLDNAALYYARFIELWADADPPLQPRVEAARARLDEILRERG